MPALPLILSWLWNNKQIIAEIIGGIAIALVIWWFGFHVPAKLKEEQAKTATLTRQVESAQKSITLLGDIQEGKKAIDDKVQAQLTSAHHIVFKHHTTSIFLRAGRGVLPAVHTSRKTTR
jgi:hypothetical protein